MTFLPLVNAYLHTASRRPVVYWVRCLFAAAALVVSFFVCLSDRDYPSSEVADDLLTALMVVSFFYCMAMGLVLTVDCVSQEKREGTLGLLFLTDLKGWDIVLGKLVAASLGGFSGLLAVVPILALSLLLGGVSAGTVGREVLLLLVTFFFQMTLGLLVSVLSRKQLRALVGTTAGLLFFNAVLPVVGGVLILLARSHRSLVGECLLLPCSVVTLVTSTDTPPMFWRHHFWWSLAVIFGLAWIFVGLASLIVPHCWQDRPAEGWKARWQRSWRKWSFGNPEQRRRLRAGLLELSPCCWLAARARHKSACVWAFLLLLGGLWLWGSIHYGADWFHEGVYLPTALLLNGVLKTWVAVEAGRQLFEDRKAGALELILTTPLSVKEIIRGHLLAMRRQFLGPFLVAIAVQCIFLAASLQRESFSANALTPTLWLLCILLLLADSAAVCWVGMWAALTVKRANHPPGVTIVRLLAVPTILYYAFLLVLSASFEPRTMHELSWKFFVGLWVGLGLLFDAAYGLVAWRQLRTRFRLLLAEPAPSFRAQFLGWLGRRKPSEAEICLRARADWL